MPRPRLGWLGLAVLLLATSVGPVAATDRNPIAIGMGPYHTPLTAADILDRADLERVGRFATLPFRVSSHTIRTLAWAELPSNDLGLPRLAIRPGSDPDGIPYKVVDGKNYYSPGNVAADGLRFVDGYVRTGNPAYLDRAVVRANKLRQLAIRRDGSMVFPYLFDYPNERLTAPWASAYAQGFALSLFVRLYRVTGEWSYAEDARRVFQSFRNLGPTRRHWVAYAPNGDLWLEEYPSSRPTHVLNGFNFALFGLYDYERLTRDPTASQMLRGALATIRKYGSSYRVPGGISYYDLVHRTRHEHYHEIHIWQLRDLTAISGDPWYAQLAALLAADHG